MAVELVSRGAQDVYLTGQPEVSFFRQNFRRYTNFAQRNVKLNFIGTAAANSEISIKIPNKGDLLSYMWVDLGSATVDTNGIDADSSDGGAIFELWIGGQLVDRQDAFFMVQHWNKYLADSSVKPWAASAAGTTTASNWLPLHFFFCDFAPLPLVALAYHEVEVRVKFSSSAVATQPVFYANYVLLDTDERAAFTNTDHELLIEQVQKISYGSGNTKFDLSLLNHPVKSLHFSNVASGTAVSDGIQLYLNGNESYNVPMPAKFFNQVQGYYHSEFYSAELSRLDSSLFMLSFALKASKHQPCGTCNFSRIDTAALNVTGADGYLYAVNYNILRIKQGMAGIAFSN